MKPKGGFFLETFKTLVIALLIAFVLRTFLFQPFHIPSASMEPTLYKGDYIITTKYSLGYGKHAATPFELPIETGRVWEQHPKRGDVIVFKPEGSDVHFIKRLIGLPGDDVQMIDGFLYINGNKQNVIKIAESALADNVGNFIRVNKYKETLDGNQNFHMIFDEQIGSVDDNTDIFSVPDGHFFFMGDNRDNSGDSRRSIENNGVGFVQATNLVGRAEFVLLSVNDEFKLIKPWTWGNFRGDRFFKGLR